MEELEFARWAGQAGGAGVIMYVLVRFGPAIETFLRGGRNGTKHEYPEMVRSREALTWEAMITHCDRTHRASAELADSRYGSLEKALEALRNDLREALKELRQRIDHRNGTK